MMNNFDTIFIQNIISPYRARFFNKLNEVYPNFKLFYMGKSEPDKYWDVSKIDIQYKHWIDTHGLCLMLSKTLIFHFNPLMLWEILRAQEAKNIVLAVSWNDPNIFFILIMKRLGLLNKRLFFWAEANYLTNGSRNENSLKLALKRFAFNTVDGAMIIPGKMSKITFAKWNIQLKNIIYLPNVINDSGLYYEHQNMRGKSLLPIFILPMRIIESLKGALNFFEAIGKENITQAIFIIAGDGPDYDKYKEYIDLHGYTDHIILKGFCGTDAMKNLYNQADAFLLPSFSDSSPLTLVEALNLRLPVLCSSHCGNHFEAVEEGVNGYTFSPLDHNDIKNKFELFISRRSEWKEMGEKSAAIYKSKFETDTVVNKFVDQYKLYKK